MAEWRIGRGWSPAELERAAQEALGWDRNFDPDARMTPDEGWRHYTSETVIAREGPGPPAADGPYERAWSAIVRYEFSNPRIVRGHFDPAAPLGGRLMLLELQALRLHFLVPVRVGPVRDDQDELQTVRGYRYETLQGHIESGWEWFLLTKSHATGEIRFKIAAEWRPGDFPNWWTRLGFRVLGRHYQRKWSRGAHVRLRNMLEEAQ